MLGLRAFIVQRRAQGSAAPTQFVTGPAALLLIELLAFHDESNLLRR